MRFRTVALALALACGFMAPMEAKQKTTTTHRSKPGKVKKAKFKKYKPGKFKPAKFKPAKVK
jgi:coenzyme F420-reducing hydrogenase beta subunit